MQKRQIIFVRHAKAIESEDWDGSDFDRPLTPHGENANRIVANYLRLIGVRPDRIISSPAVRTRDTALGIAEKFGIQDIEYEKNLYLQNNLTTRGAIRSYMNIIHKTPKNCHILLIVGHNPDITNVAEYLAGESIPSMKKGSIVVLSLPEGEDWRSLDAGETKFVYYLTPQFLRLEELI